MTRAVAPADFSCEGPGRFMTGQARLNCADYWQVSALSLWPRPAVSVDFERVGQARRSASGDLFGTDQDGSLQAQDKIRRSASSSGQPFLLGYGVSVTRVLAACSLRPVSD